MEFIYEIVDDNRIQVIGIQQEDIMETDIIIPEQIEGMQVTMIGPHAFSNRKELQRVSLPSSIERIGNYAFSECRGLSEMMIPRKVKELGDHVFYNCRGLSRVAFSGELTKIGDGAFKNCNALAEITVMATSQNSSTGKQIIPDISKELIVRIEYEDSLGKSQTAKLFFPKESVEMSDFSTRLYMDVQYGVGTYYRQTVLETGIDYRKYDQLFGRAQGELGKESLMLIVLSRLMYPYELGREEKERYETYLLDHCSFVIKEVIEKAWMEELQYLLEAQWIQKDNIEEAIKIAQEKEQTESMGYLIEWKHSWCNKREQTFEL